MCFKRVDHNSCSVFVNYSSLPHEKKIVSRELQSIILLTEDRNIRKISGPGKSLTGTESPASNPGSGSKCFTECVEKHKGFCNLVGSIIPTAVRQHEP